MLSVGRITRGQGGLLVWGGEAVNKCQDEWGGEVIASWGRIATSYGI